MLAVLKTEVNYMTKLMESGDLLLPSRTRPARLTTPFKLFLCARKDKKVFIECTCDKIYNYDEVPIYYNSKFSRSAKYFWHITDIKFYATPKPIFEFLKPCISPECPYCPACPVGHEWVDEEEAYYFSGEGYSTEWQCLNYVTEPPHGWCYIEVKE